MKRLLGWAWPGRSDEALADVLDLYERRAARVGRARARLRLAVDLLTLVVLGLRRASGQLVIGLPGDLRCALRLLRQSPAFSAAAVLILALGIGANTAIFSIVNVVLLTPIPTDERAVVGIYSRDMATPGRYRSFSYNDYGNIRAAGAPFTDVVAYTYSRLGLKEGSGDTRRTSAVIATSNYFRLLRTRLALGREFTAEEERPGSDIRVVIVGYPYWQSRGKAPSILGSSLRLNGRDYTIVGVAPEGFTGTTMALLSAEFWLPTGVYEHGSDDVFRENRKERLADPSTRVLMLIGRLQSGLTTEAAQPALAGLTARLVELDPAANAGYGLMVQKVMRTGITGQPATDKGPTALSLLLMATASLVLLLACLNLANMLLARGTTRSREIAVRVAVGGGRVRIVRQLLVESLVLALIGGAAGLLLATIAIRLFVSSAAAAMPGMMRFDGRPDIRVLAATIVFSAISTVAAGFGPAWGACRRDVVADLKDHPARVARIGRLSARNLMVVAQVAVCLALLVAAGLFVRSAIETAAANPGFSLDRSIVLNIAPALAGYGETRSRTATGRVLERLRAIPGIESASFGSIVPFGNENDGRAVQRATGVTGTNSVGATYTIVGGDYFETLGIPVLQGRGFSAAEELTGAADGVVIDHALAIQLFGDEPAIGQLVRFDRDSDPERAMPIVGVVGDVRDGISDVRPHVYVPYGRAFVSDLYVHVRARAGIEPAGLVPVIRQVVTQVDGELPILKVQTLEQFRRGSLQLWVVNAAARVFSSFGAVALVLAVAGVYGMKAYVVSRRTREIAIRLALGATPGGVVRMIVREGLVLTATGLIIGVAAALGIGRVLSAILFGVSPTDPLVLAIAIAVLGSAALVATYLPARRATKLTPTSALRAE